MNNLNDIYKKLLKEQINDDLSNIQILQDMDGCLTNFKGAAVDKINEILVDLNENPSQYQQRYPKIYKSGVKLLKQQNQIDLSDIENKTNNKLARNFMYRALGNNEDFWANLDWMPDGKQLWNYVKQFDPMILSAPMKEGSEAGKMKWIQNNLGLSSNRVILDQEKHQYATVNGKTGLLIDDYEKYIGPFESNGGIVILHKGASNTINELKELGFQ